MKVNGTAVKKYNEHKGVYAKVSQFGRLSAYVKPAIASGVEEIASK